MARQSPWRGGRLELAQGWEWCLWRFASWKDARCRSTCRGMEWRLSSAAALMLVVRFALQSQGSFWTSRASCRAVSGGCMSTSMASLFSFAAKVTGRSTRGASRGARLEERTKGEPWAGTRVVDGCRSFSQGQNSCACARVVPTRCRRHTLGQAGLGWVPGPPATTFARATARFSTGWGRARFLSAPLALSLGRGIRRSSRLRRRRREAGSRRRVRVRRRKGVRTAARPARKQVPLRCGSRMSRWRRCVQWCVAQV
mmetsp:Transcript_62468/g.129763  ORF Transcript_62468/g.129763 Transcript_62468/m.129763 type:complete len:256 (+) Transcript_62468:1583-2350(+)